MRIPNQSIGRTRSSLVIEKTAASESDNVRPSGPLLALGCAAICLLAGGGRACSLCSLALFIPGL